MMPYYRRLKKEGPPHRLEKYGLLSYRESLLALQKALHAERISYGLYDLMRGLLAQGSIVDYPAGEGINYTHLIKNTLDSNSVKNALIELGNKIPEKTGIIFGIQNSGVSLANVVGFHTRKRVETIFKSTKETYRHDPLFGVMIDSYTKGIINILSIDPILFKRWHPEDKHQTIRIAFVDDICDTGTLLCAVTGLINNLSHYLNIKIQIVKLLALFERTHTASREKLKKDIDMGLTSVAKVEDMGQEPYSWIKIKGIDHALSFAFQ